MKTADQLLSDALKSLKEKGPDAVFVDPPAVVPMVFDDDEAETVTVRGVAIGDVTVDYQGFDDVDENFYRNELIAEYNEWLAEHDLDKLSADELYADMLEDGIYSSEDAIPRTCKDFVDRFERLERMISEQFR